MLDELRKQVLDANLELVRQGLVLYTFGNASGVSRAAGLVAIKPSGVPYETMRPDDLVITDLNGRVVEGKLRPSSDLDTHLELYRSFPEIGGVVHTHSRFATVWAQAGREIPCLGTTHADYFRGAVPVTEKISAEELHAYELNTGKAIVRRFASLDPAEFPGVLVTGHGPFCWGRSAREAAHTAVVLETIAHMAYLSVTLNSEVRSLASDLIDKHFLRKHGSKAYYGQV